MDTLLPQPTMTISSDASLIMTERSTATGVERQLVLTVIVAAIVSVIFASGVTFFMLSNLDGQKWVGWTGQEVVMNGKPRRILIPMFMRPADLDDLRRNK